MMTMREGGKALNCFVFNVGGRRLEVGIRPEGGVRRYIHRGKRSSRDGDNTYKL